MMRIISISDNERFKYLLTIIFFGTVAMLFAINVAGVVFYVLTAHNIYRQRRELENTLVSQQRNYHHMRNK